MTARTPTIAPAVADYMRGEIVRAPEMEHTFVATYDGTTRTVTDAEHVGIGTRRKGLLFPGDYKPGSLHLHTHPTGEVGLSDADFECAQTLGATGVGFGVIDNLVSTLFLAREPRLPWQLREPSASPSKFRVWRLLGGFSVVHQGRA